MSYIKVGDTVSRMEKNPRPIYSPSVNYFLTKEECKDQREWELQRGIKRDQSNIDRLQKSIEQIKSL